MPPVGVAIAAAAGAAASVVGIAAVNAAFALVGSLALSAIAQRLLRRSLPSPQQVRFDLLQPNSRIVKRFVYGTMRAPATPVRRWVVGGDLYQLTIMNSRPSAVTDYTVYFDGRASEVVSGDAFDFSGPGAQLRITENFPDFGDTSARPRVWIGRGDQVGPPLALLDELGGFVVRFDFDLNAFSFVELLQLTINGTQYSWTSSSAFSGPSFDPVGDAGGFQVKRATTSPFSVEVTHPDQGLEFSVTAGSATRRFMNIPTTFQAVSFGSSSAFDLRATDALQGLTVMWIKMNAGDPEPRFDRWPNGTRTEIDVEADWSLVCDPRDPAQDFDDPSTWQWSDNQAVCLLDAILNNPIRRWPRFLVNMQSFIAAADLADEAVPLRAGGTVPRYTANGILVWNGAEIMDQVQPLADAGAGEVVKIGGQITYSNGAARATDYTITDILDGQGLSFTRLRPSSDLPVAVRATYLNPARDWQESELPAIAVGAGGLSLGDDGITAIQLIFVTEPTQAMRVQKIVRNRVAAQKRITCMLPPDAIQLVPGSVCEWGIDEVPYLAGRWRVEEINPHVWLSGEDGVAMRCIASLAQEPDNLDAWNPEVDEFELATEDYIPPAPIRVPPDDLSATTGPGVASGDVPRIRFSFEPVEGNVIGYEWQWRVTGESYGEGGTISADVRDTSDRVFGFLVPVVVGMQYQIRVRTLYIGPVSDWTEVTATAQGIDFDLDPPSDGQAIGGEGQIEVSFVTPNNVAFEAIEFWGSSTDDVSAAVLLATIASAANTVRTIVETDLGDDVTRFYFSRSRGPQSSVSDFSASVSATTDP